MLNRFYSQNAAFMIDYRPIIEKLEEALTERTDGVNVFSKQTQAEIDHIQSLLDSYEHILEDIEAEGGLATRSADLDELSNEAVRLLVNLRIVTDMEAAALLDPKSIAEIEGDEDADSDEDNVEDEESDNDD